MSRQGCCATRRACGEAGETQNSSPFVGVWLPPEFQKSAGPVRVPEVEDRVYPRVYNGQRQGGSREVVTSADDPVRPGRHFMTLMDP